MIKAYKKPDTEIKILVTGDGGVGKTCLLISYAQNKYPEEYIPTVFDNYHLDVAVNDKIFQIGLWDTARREDYSRLAPLSYPGTDVVLLAYPTANLKSNWIQNYTERTEQIYVAELKHYIPHVPIILVGTKVDLKRNRELNPPETEYLEFEDGKALAQKWGCVSYLECSALTQEGLKNVFDEAIQVIVKKRMNEKKEKKGLFGWLKKLII